MSQLQSLQRSKRNQAFQAAIPTGTAASPLAQQQYTNLQNKYQAAEQEYQTGTAQYGNNAHKSTQQSNLQTDGL